METTRPIVAVVDDDPRLLESLEELLESAGFAACCFRSAEHLLARGLSNIDLLITDIGMPGTNGYALLETVRGRPGPSIPAIALTAYARLEDRDRVLKAGFQLHVPKPIEPASLVRAVALVANRS